MWRIRSDTVVTSDADEKSIARTNRGFGDDAMKKLKAILGVYSIVYSVFLVCFAIVLFAASKFGYHCVYDYPNVSFDTILSNVILFIIGIPIIISAFLKPENMLH